MVGLTTWCEGSGYGDEDYAFSGEFWKEGQYVDCELDFGEGSLAYL